MRRSGHMESYNEASNLIQTLLAILLKYFTSYFQKAKGTLVLFLTGFVTVSEPRSHLVAQASLFQLDVLCSQG